MASSTPAEKQKERVHHDHPTGSNDRDAPPSGHLDNNAKQCTCDCPVHPPPEPKPEPKVEMFACGHKKGGRSLIVCIDGTANQFGMKNTNVVELYNLVLKGTGDNQLTWYNSGIGTYVPPDRWSLQSWIQAADHMIDTAIAWHFKDTILKAYRWLSDNYQDGDCIFLFGFSRGAFQVRTLAGMIEKVGLIHKGNEAQIPFAYELYADPNSDTADVTTQVGSNSKDKVSMAERFKKAFSRKDVKVHFVGAWDTVSSIGVAREKSVLPLTTDGMTHVCYFRHALALDERRVKFLPEYAWGGTTLPPTPESTRVGHDSRERPHISEVWFPGTHSDIGGGNVTNATMDRGRPPLRWMASQAAELGLRVEAFPRELSPNEQIEFRESLSFGWMIFELYPFLRLTFSRRSGMINSTTRRPHLGAGRNIHEGQKIHFSFIEGETDPQYIPKACPPTTSSTFWEDLRTEALRGSFQLIERDVFYRAADAVGKLLAGEETLFKEVIADPTGYQFLYDEVIETIQSWDRRTPKLELEAKCRFLCAVIGVFPENLENLKLEKWSENPTFLNDVLRSDSARPEHREAAQNFRRRFIKDVNCLLELREHASRVSSVQFLPDGARLVSGSWDRTIRIWDATKGSQVGAPLQGHSNYVNSVAISPDGKCIVSGSIDGTIRIWDAETKHVGEPLQGHTYPVLSVAISPDGKHIVSGSWDNTIRIWDAETGKQVGEPLQGHTHSVRSVAISPDSKRIVSGSNDSTIRIWDTEKGEQVGEPLEGHTGAVYSVAISPDGKRIVSGALDDTIRIWDLEKGMQVGEPLRGHMGFVLSVAMSSDGNYIVSGSSDDTIRIWDLETRVQVGEPLRGHTDPVRSVAISPDGNRIASGSLDNTIQIWSTEGILY